MKLNKISTIVIILLLANLIFLGNIIFLIKSQKATESSSKNSTTELINKDEREDYKNENIVFLGDSITDWCPFENLYEEYVPIINSGRAGYKTFNILDEMENLVYKYNPTKVFILIGTNDLNMDYPTKKTVKNIEKMIKGIKKNRSKCKIYVQSIYPINKTDAEKINKKEKNNRENSTIQEVNKNLKRICKENNVTYIDMYNELIDEEGNLSLEYTVDGLHISPLGYMRITKRLLKYVEE